MQEVSEPNVVSAAREGKRSSGGAAQSFFSAVGLILEQTLLINKLNGRDRCDNDKDQSQL